MGPDLDTPLNAALCECGLRLPEEGYRRCECRCLHCRSKTCESGPTAAGMGKECTVRRQVDCGGEVSQDVSALPSVVPLQCFQNRLRRKGAPTCRQLQVQTIHQLSASTPRSLPRYFQVQGRRVSRSHEGPIGSQSHREKTLRGGSKLPREGRTRQLKA